MTNINPNAIPEFNEIKEEIFRKIDAGEELTMEEKQVAENFINLCKTLTQFYIEKKITIATLIKRDKELHIAADYERLTGKPLIPNVEKTPKM